MSQPRESTDQFVAKIKAGIRFFDPNDADLYNDEILIAFAQADKMIVNRLPKDLLTDPVLLAIAQYSRYNLCMNYISPEQTEIYREIAMIAVSTNHSNLKFVKADIVDVDFIQETVARGPRSLCGFFERYHDLVHQIYDKQSLEAAIREDRGARTEVMNMVLREKLETPLITDTFIQESLLLGTSLISFILKNHRKHLAIELIGRGEWPASLANDKPSDLNDAVKRMMKPMSSTTQDWQRAYAMTFPIAEAVKAMKTKSKLELLETIYTRAEILPHLTQRRDLKAKGRWLEEDLGM